MAEIYPIVGRQKKVWFRLAKKTDFVLGTGKLVAASLALEPRFTPYLVDFELGEVWFTQTPNTAEALRSPFFYFYQYQAADQILTMSLSEFLELNPPMRCPHLVWIHSIARSGSTLLSKVFQMHTNCISISEPDALAHVMLGLRDGRVSEADSIMITQKLCAKLSSLVMNDEQTYLVLKARSYVLDTNLPLNAIDRNSRSLFVYRNPRDTILSTLRHFHYSEGARAKSHDVEMLVEKYLKQWIESIQQYRELVEKGLTIRALKYENLTDRPAEMLQKAMRHCGLHFRPECLEAFSHRSQEGTPIVNGRAEVDDSLPMVFDAAFREIFKNEFDYSSMRLPSELAP